MFGTQHYNMLIRGAKVYILSDHFKNYFGVIVGHTPDFDIKSNTPPNLKIIITDSLEITTPEIHTDSKWIVKLINFHDTINSAVPTKSPNIINCHMNKKKIAAIYASQWIVKKDQFEI